MLFRPPVRLAETRLAEADGAVGERGGTGVGGDDDNGVSEIDGLAVEVGDAANVEQLQEQVEDLRVRLLDFIKEDDAVRAAAHSLGKLTGLIVADVARRGADQPRCLVAFHEFGHVELDEYVFVSKESLRQRPRQFGFAYACGADKDEGANRSPTITDVRARAAHGLGDGAHGFVLADDAPVQFVFQPQQAPSLLSCDLCDRNACPQRNYFSNLLLTDNGPLLSPGRHPLLLDETQFAVQL